MEVPDQLYSMNRLLLFSPELECISWVSIGRRQLPQIFSEALAWRGHLLDDYCTCAPAVSCSLKPTV